MTFGKEGEVGGKGKFRPLFEKDANVRHAETFLVGFDVREFANEIGNPPKRLKPSL